MPLQETEIRLTKSSRTLSGFLELPLNSDQLSMLQKLGRKRHLSRGEQVLSMGSTVNAIYILNAGSAEIHGSSSDGEREMMRTVGRGEILGLTEVLAGTVSDLEISSASESVFTEIPRDEFIAFLRKDANMCFDLASMMAAAFVHCFHVVSR